MIWLWVFIIAVFLFSALMTMLLCSRLSVIISYRDGKVSAVLKSFLFRITLDEKFISRFGKKKKQKTNDKKPKSEEKNVEGFFAKIKRLKKQYDEVKGLIDEILRYAGSRVEFSDIYIRSAFGTGDAATTGMAYGAAWALVGNVYGYLCKFVNVKFPTVELLPDYNEKKFKIEAQGIIKIRIVHIIGCIIKLAKIKASKK